MIRQKTIKGKIGAKIGIFKGKKYPLPKGCRLKEDNLKFDYDLEKYLWRPEKGDFIYYPNYGKIYKYLGWRASLPGNFVSLSGYGHLRNMETGEILWVRNIEIREGIPMRKI